jgi:hypothetical protein
LSTPAGTVPRPTGIGSNVKLKVRSGKIPGGSFLKG